MFFLRISQNLAKFNKRPVKFSCAQTSIIKIIPNIKIEVTSPVHLAQWFPTGVPCEAARGAARLYIL